MHDVAFFGVNLRGFFRITLSELTAAIPAGNCSKVCDLREEGRNPQEPNKMPSRLSLRFDVNRLFSRSLWMQHELYWTLTFIKQTHIWNSSYCGNIRKSKLSARFTETNSCFTMLISIISNNKETCNARTDSMNGRVESVKICISAICIDNSLARRDRMQKTSYNSHIWFVNNMFDWRQTCALVAITETWPPLTVNMF